MKSYLSALQEGVALAQAYIDENLAEVQPAVVSQNEKKMHAIIADINQRLAVVHREVNDEKPLETFLSIVWHNMPITFYTTGLRAAARTM